MSSSSCDSFDGPPPPTPPPRTGSHQGPAEHADTGADSGALSLSFAAYQMMSVAKPVTVCMVLVIWLVRMIEMGSDHSQTRWSGLAYNEDANTEDSSAQKLGGALLNALILVVVIVIMTSLFVALYKYRCMKIIYGWLLTSSAMMLGAVGAFIFLKLLTVYNAPLDIPSFLFILWNFALVGLAAIFWRAPLRLQQVYLILSSAFLATMFFSLFPEWTTWTILGAVAVYDILAVLCPKGPLRILVETASERPDQPLPALLYSAGMAYTVALMADSGDPPEPSTSAKPSSTAAPPSRKQTKLVTVINEDGTRVRAKYRYEYEYEYDDSDDDDDRDGARRSRRSAPAPILFDSADDDDHGDARDDARTIGPTGSHDADDCDSDPPAPVPFDDHDDIDPERAASMGLLSGTREAGGGALAGSDDDAPHYASPMDPESGRGLKLGLGDLIFYSVLVSHAAVSDLISMVTTFIAVLNGLILTLACLGILGRALPALPFSIALGILFYLLTKLLITPYLMTLFLAGVYA